MSESLSIWATYIVDVLLLFQLGWVILETNCHVHQKNEGGDYTCEDLHDGRKSIKRT